MRSPACGSRGPALRESLQARGAVGTSGRSRRRSNELRSLCGHGSRSRPTGAADAALAYDSRVRGDAVAQVPTATITPRQAAIIRGSLLVFVAVLVLLVFAVPRTPPPPPSLAQPDQAFVDRVGIVSPDFARQWAGGLLNDDRAQIVVYVDRKPPEGDLSAWAIQTASDWKIGAAKDDTGLVVFVFTEPRLARIDVGYGLEDRLTDARVRQLLERHLVPAFSRGEYERGFDALIFALRKELGGDDADSIHARAAEARKRADVPWFSQVGIAFARVPQVVVGTVEAFREGNFAARLPI